MRSLLCHLLVYYVVTLPSPTRKTRNQRVQPSPRIRNLIKLPSFSPIWISQCKIVYDLIAVFIRILRLFGYPGMSHFESPRLSNSLQMIKHTFSLIDIYGCILCSCPPDSVRLGNHTWTFLHTMAAYYPSHPSRTQQNDMNSFLSLFSKFYPCGYCADHLKEYINEHPPVVSNNQDLSQWMCQVHNEVNERLGTLPLFSSI